MGGSENGVILHPVILHSDGFLMGPGAVSRCSLHNMGSASLLYSRGGHSNGPYADSLPLSSHFQGGGGGEGGGLGRGGRGASLGGGGGLPDPNIYGLK